MMVPVQRSFEEMGDPLSDVTFCVLDFETTGGDVNTCWITEIGVVKVRGGECLGTFQTLVNPGGAIPPTITMLTGISHQMVSRAPRIESVLPTLLEFLGDSVIVAHNLRFDLSFLQAALRRDGREPLHNRTLDTVALARRLLRDEVPNCKLGTLASHLRLPHQPSHRALEDALATADLLHLLIERAAGLGVAGFDDLVFLPTMAGHKYAQKLDLTARLPRSPGIYLFRNARNEVLYVGKATNLRSRVRSYFSTDERRKVGSLLAETARIDHKQTATVFVRDLTPTAPAGRSLCM
jgi:DNA polymerase-3 subunit epsilon